MIEVFESHKLTSIELIGINKRRNYTKTIHTRGFFKSLTFFMALNGTYLGMYSKKALASVSLVFLNKRSQVTHVVLSRDSEQATNWEVNALTVYLNVKLLVPKTASISLVEKFPDFYYELMEIV